MRTPKVSAKESAVDLSILGAVCAFGFPIAKAYLPNLPDGVESTGTALVMAIGGALARYWRKRSRSK